MSITVSAGPRRRLFLGFESFWRLALSTAPAVEPIFGDTGYLEVLEMDATVVAVAGV